MSRPTMTPDLANRRTRAEGRTEWSEAACDEMQRLLPDEADAS